MLVLMSSAVVLKASLKRLRFVGLNAQFNGSDKIRTEENEIVYYRSDGCQLHGQRSEYEANTIKAQLNHARYLTLMGMKKKSSTSK